MIPFTSFHRRRHYVVRCRSCRLLFLFNAMHCLNVRRRSPLSKESRRVDPIGMEGMFGFTRIIMGEIDMPQPTMPLPTVRAASRHPAILYFGKDDTNIGKTRDERDNSKCNDGETTNTIFLPLKTMEQLTSYDVALFYLQYLASTKLSCSKLAYYFQRIHACDGCQ